MGRGGVAGVLGKSETGERNSDRYIHRPILTNTVFTFVLFSTVNIAQNINIISKISSPFAVGFISLLIYPRQKK